MLKLIVKKEPLIEPQPLSGQRIGYELETGSGVWINDIWQADQKSGWIYVDRIASYNKRAANLLHATELGIASAARWIAIELLKHPKPPAKKKMVKGVALGITPDWKQCYELHLMTQFAAQETMGFFSRDNLLYLAYGFIDTTPSPGPMINFSSQEGAVSEIIKHGAPWMAAALVAEIGAKP